MDDKLLKFKIKIDPQNIGMLRFILEAHEGLAIAESIDPKNGVVVVYVPESQSKDMKDLFCALTREEIRIFDIVEI